MTNDPQPTRFRRPLLVVLTVAIAIAVVALIALMMPRGEQTDARPALPPVSVTASPSPSLSRSSSAAAASSSPVAAPTGSVPAECTDPGDGFVPTRFAIPALGAEERVVSLNLDAEGNIAAPPKDQARTAAWWNAGPKPGSSQGKALLSVHTYRTGKALGNELYAAGEPQLARGDLIKLYGEDGQVQCYEFTRATKVRVADYDPRSDVMVDYEGKPQLAIIICWDYTKATRTWDSRIFFYASPVTTAT